MLALLLHLTSFHETAAMLGSERPATSPTEVASELRDALRRRQKELPPRWLAAVDAATLSNPSAAVTGHALDATERDLGLDLLATHLADTRPRGVVCVQPSASAATAALVQALSERGSVTAVAATELDASLASEMIDRLGGRRADRSCVAFACDATLELPLAENFPRPRVYLCLGNVLGGTTTVGAVRMLRILRTTMSPGDTIVLGLDVRRDSGAGLPAEPKPDRHVGALGLLKAATGVEIDPARFDYRPSYDSDNHRIETHLVARRAFTVDVPGMGDVRFRKGESIRTSVRCVFDRARVTAMLGGVGLALRQWTTDPAATYVVALATTAT
jgi:L-histidine N-alpha-methyltransferase